MNISYTLVASILFCLFDAAAISAQPIFLDTTSDSIFLCTNDPGVRLPATNQLYLGEGHHGASSCSVHLTQSTKVKIDCGTQVQYEIRVILFDTSAEYVLRPLTTISTDSLSEAELIFDTEFSPEFEIMQHGIPYTSGCYRYHRIKWIVTDECGGSAMMEKLVDVYDCSDPVNVFPDHLFTLRTYATEFINFDIDTFDFSWLDDCSGSSELLLSLDASKHKTDSVLDACNAPGFGVELPFPVFIADKGRDLNCDGAITWEERHITESYFLVVLVDYFGLCHPKIDAFIAGTIETDGHSPLPDVAVHITSPHQNYPLLLTNAKGDYMTYAQGDSVTIKPKKNDSHKNGVSTLDVVRIHKHITGIDTITSPYDLIAADVNGNHQVSILDMVSIRKLILGVYTEFPFVESWKFVPKEFQFTDPLKPFPFPETIFVEDPFTISYNGDFIAVKMGDVNNTVFATGTEVTTRNEKASIEWIAQQQDFLINDHVTIPVYATDDFRLNGFQFTLTHPDLEFVNVTSGQIEISDDAYAIFDDHMTFSWYDLDPLQINNDEPLFSIVARAKQNGSLSDNLKINSDITQAEVYDADQNIFEPRLIIQSEEHIVNNEVIVYPNPWKEEIHISFEMRNSGAVDFKLFDALGSEVYSIEEEAVFGENIITVNKEDVSATGLLFYKLSTKDFRATGVMVKPD